MYNSRKTRYYSQHPIPKEKTKLIGGRIELNWSDEWPTKPGTYLFYGIFAAHHSDPKLFLFHVGYNKDGLLVASLPNGGVVWRVKGWWHRLTISLPLMGLDWVTNEEYREYLNRIEKYDEK